MMYFPKLSKAASIMNATAFARARALVMVFVGLALLAFLASAAKAQGCAMCYQSAAATGTQGREVLRHGILVLLLPSLGLFFGIFGLIYKRRNFDRLSR